MTQTCSTITPKSLLDRVCEENILIGCLTNSSFDLSFRNCCYKTKTNGYSIFTRIDFQKLNFQYKVFFLRSYDSLAERFCGWLVFPCLKLYQSRVLKTFEDTATAKATLAHWQSNIWCSCLINDPILSQIVKKKHVLFCFYFSLISFENKTYK